MSLIGKKTAASEPASAGIKCGVALIRTENWLNSYSLNEPIMLEFPFIVIRRKSSEMDTAMTGEICWKRWDTMTP
jgi:hypothetical protein